VLSSLYGAVRCRALQGVAGRCSVLYCVGDALRLLCGAVRCSALQCVAACCSALQCAGVVLHLLWCCDDVPRRDEAPLSPLPPPSTITSSPQTPHSVLWAAAPPPHTHTCFVTSLWFVTSMEKGLSGLMTLVATSISSTLSSFTLPSIILDASVCFCYLLRCMPCVYESRGLKSQRKGQRKSQK